MSNLIEITKNFKNKNILVIGDVMLDKYIFGNVERISPEAPVQILDVKEEKFVPGGAANVANNIAALGATAHLIGIAGNDSVKDTLLNELDKRDISTNGIFIDDKRPTIHKVRVLGHQQQLIRIDYEKREYLNKEMEAKILSHIQETYEEMDAIIISDYAKGIITKTLMDSIKAIGDKPIIVDPKPKHKDFYKGVNLITPNSKEAKEMSDKEDIEGVGSDLMSKLEAPILITRGEKGMTLFQKEESTTIPTKAKEVYDVSGAGDTAVATLTLALVAGADLKDAAVLSNHAAGITVGKIGTSTVTPQEIIDDINLEK